MEFDWTSLIFVLDFISLNWFWFGSRVIYLFIYFVWDSWFSVSSKGFSLIFIFDFILSMGVVWNYFFEFILILIEIDWNLFFFLDLDYFHSIVGKLSTTNFRKKYLFCICIWFEPIEKNGVRYDFSLKYSIIELLCETCRVIIYCNYVNILHFIWSTIYFLLAGIDILG